MTAALKRKSKSNDGRKTRCRKITAVELGQMSSAIRSIATDYESLGSELSKIDAGGVRVDGSNKPSQAIALLKRFRTNVKFAIENSSESEE